MIAQLRPALVLLALLTFTAGCLYPSLIWSLGQSLFPYQANGSLIMNRDGETIGSAIIGQTFTSDIYIWSRPSAHNSSDTNFLISGARNFPPAHPLLLEAATKRAAELRTANGLADDALLPADIVLASASGLDPHISPEAALLQAARIATARGRSLDEVEQLINQHINERTFGFIGQRHVNVLKLNIALDTYAGVINDR